MSTRVRHSNPPSMDRGSCITISYHQMGLGTAYRRFFVLSFLLIHFFFSFCIDLIPSAYLPTYLTFCPFHPSRVLRVIIIIIIIIKGGKEEQEEAGLRSCLYST